MSGTLFSPTAENDDENMVTTMGGLGGLLGQLFPGNQNQPRAVPGLTDLTFTRSFGGPGENFISSLFQDSGQAPRFWSPTGMGDTSPLAAPQFEPAPEPSPQQDFEPALSSALGSLFGGLAAAAASPQAEAERLRRLEATRDITNFMPNFDYSPSFTPSTNIDVSPTISPTLTNIQQQSQEQAQYMGPGTNRQQQEQEDSDVSPESRFDLDSYIRDVLTGAPNKGALSSFFL